MRNCGYAILVHSPEKTEIKKMGVIKGNKKDFSRNILHIISFLHEIKKRHKPDIVSIESPYIGLNYRGALTSARLIGAITYSFIKESITVKEIPPMLVKKLVAGYGSCTKSDIARILNSEFRIKKTTPFDATDACAVALATLRLLALHHNYEVKNF